MATRAHWLKNKLVNRWHKGLDGQRRFSDGVCDKTTTERGGKNTGSLSKNSKPEKSWCIKWNHMGKKCDNVWEGVCVCASVCVCVCAHVTLRDTVELFAVWFIRQAPGPSLKLLWDANSSLQWMQLFRSGNSRHYEAIYNMNNLFTALVLWARKASCRVDVSAVLGSGTGENPRTDQAFMLKI